MRHPHVRYPFCHSLLSALISIALVFLVPVASRAGTVSTEALTAETAAPGSLSVAESRAHIHRMIDRPELTRELTRLGVAPREAHRRIDAMSDAEIRVLKGQLDEAPAGGWVGAVLGAILIVFFVLLFTDLIGATDVFPWVRKH